MIFWTNEAVCPGPDHALAHAQVFCRFLAAVRHNVVTDLGALVQSAKPGFLDRRDVHEHILAAAVRLNETIALLPVKPLHCSCRQVESPPKDLSAHYRP